MDDKRPPNRTRRALGVFGAGVLVAGAAYLLAFRELRYNLANFRYMDVATMHELDVIERAVEEYRKTTGRLPGDLAELEKSVGRPSPPGDPISIVDPWRHPYQYRVDGDRFVLYSYGRDGRPGGVGIHADIFPRSAGRSFEPATFRQFVFEIDSGDGRLVSLLSGIVAGTACFHAAGKFRGVELGFSIVATTLGAMFVGSILCAMHIVPGH